MALDTYDGLKAEIADYLDRDDLTDQIDGFIDIAEGRHAREVRIQEMLVRQSVQIVARYMDFPLLYLEARSFRITNPFLTLENVNYTDMNQLRKDREEIPKYYTVHEQIEFDVEPDQSYPAEILYYKKLPPLTSSQTTNALLAKAPDIYLYSSLVASAPFLMNDERLGTWETLYANAKQTLMLSEDRFKRAGRQVTRAKGV